MSRVGKKATSCGEKVGNWREKNLIQLRLLEEIAILAVPLYEAAVAMIAVGIDSASPRGSVPRPAGGARCLMLASPVLTGRVAVTSTQTAPFSGPPTQQWAVTE